ncbi:MAG: amidohydrolase family protein [Deltaproteobacteria bacterium]|nr:amidohydrolase family protein [Deltaproteobacteria bacterium]
MQLISAKHLLTMDSPPIDNGGIVVEDGKIIAAGPTADLQNRYKIEEREDYPNHVLMPGLINAHTHLDMSFHKNYLMDPVRQLGVNIDFIEWLIQCIEYKKKASPMKLKEAVQEGLASCIETGTTCVADQGGFEGIFETVKDLGVRAVVFPELISYDGKVAQDLFESGLALVEKYADDESNLIRIGLAPYAPYTISKNILRIVAAHCRANRIPLMLQTAESFQEMEFFYNSSGDIGDKLFPYFGWDERPPNFKKTPVEYLDEIKFLEAKPILVGCVQATKSDLDRIAKAGARVVISPRSNHYLQLGEAPFNAMKEKGICLALGTEGLHSNATLSLWDEMRFLQEKSNGSGIFSGEDLLTMVTKNAAQALGLEGEIGTLAPGKKADYIVVDASEIPSKGDFYSNLIRTTKTYHVKKVAVNGKTLKGAN